MNIIKLVLTLSVISNGITFNLFTGLAVDTPIRFVWMTNGENGKRLGREVSRGLAEIVRWSWW